MKKLLKKWFAFVLAVITMFSFGSVPTLAATKVNVVTGKYFTLKNAASGRYLNIYGNQNKNGANVDIYAKDGTSGQDFKFTSSGKNGYTLTPRCATSRRVNVYGDKASNKSNVCLWGATGHSTQAWIPEAVSGGYILRCANNTNYVLTATGSRNSTNVNIQKYSSGNKSQVWVCSAFSTSSNTASTTPNKNSTTNSNSKANTAGTNTVADAIKKQIGSTYKEARKLYRESFNGYCGDYVRYQLHVLGITNKNKDTDCAGNGNQWQSRVKAGKTSTGYTKTKLSGGSKCLTNIVKSYGNVKNVLISYPYQYGYSYKNPGAGHVVFIHAVINGTVYYSECYAGNGISEGGVRTKSVAEFDRSYTGSYGNALGAVWFHR